MPTRTAHLNVTGMSCANCSASIEDALDGLDGVTSANANYATDEGAVEYDPDVVSLADVYDAVEAAGYGAVSETVTVAITDMSCANCAETNADALEATPGVIEATVNYATDEAQVRYNPADASRSDLYDAVESAGYSPVREGDGDGATGRARRRAATPGRTPATRPARRRSANSSA